MRARVTGLKPGANERMWFDAAECLDRVEFITATPHPSRALDQYRSFNNLPTCSLMLEPSVGNQPARWKPKHGR